MTLPIKNWPAFCEAGLPVVVASPGIRWRYLLCKFQESCWHLSLRSAHSCFRSLDPHAGKDGWFWLR